MKEVNTKEVGDRLIYYNYSKLLRRFTTVRVGRFLPGVFPDFPPATVQYIYDSQYNFRDTVFSVIFLPILR